MAVTQHIPALFAEIAANDVERGEIRDLACIGQAGTDDWRRLGELVRDRQGLRRGAEAMLRRSSGRRGAGAA